MIAETFRHEFETQIEGSYKDKEVVDQVGAEVLNTRAMMQSLSEQIGSQEKKAKVEIEGLQSRMGAIESQVFQGVIGHSQLEKKMQDTAEC